MPTLRRASASADHVLSVVQSELTPLAEQARTSVAKRHTQEFAITTSFFLLTVALLGIWVSAGIIFSWQVGAACFCIATAIALLWLNSGNARSISSNFDVDLPALAAFERLFRRLRASHPTHRVIGIEEAGNCLIKGDYQGNPQCSGKLEVSIEVLDLSRSRVRWEIILQNEISRPSARRFAQSFGEWLKGALDADQ
jgi:hypothetical protein